RNNFLFRKILYKKIPPRASLNRFLGKPVKKRTSFRNLTFRAQPSYGYIRGKFCYSGKTTHESPIRSRSETEGASQRTELDPRRGERADIRADFQPLQDRE